MNQISIPAYIIQGSNITVVIDSKSHTISKTHVSYQKIVDAIKAGDWATVKDSIEPKQVVLKYGKGNVSISGETLYWKGQVLNTGIATRMIQMLKEGFSIDPLVEFMEKLYSNPSKRAVTELYGFLEKNALPITPDGYFLAYKKVRANYFDVHSGTMDNSVGKVVEMERNQVDDNRDKTCSTGLHFCGMSYLSHFGGDRIVIVKINPADVVSIPSDYNDAKGRACRYEVIGELNVSPELAFTKSVQTTAVGSAEPAARSAAKPVAAVKEGTSDFYQGYSEGYAGFVHCGHVQTVPHVEGYRKGAQDRLDKVAARYKFIGVDATVADSGKQLSMTKDAIRKREKRAADRAAQQGRSKLLAPTSRPTAMTSKQSPWPFPK